MGFWLLPLIWLLGPQNIISLWSLQEGLQRMQAQNPQNNKYILLKGSGDGLGKNRKIRLQALE